MVLGEATITADVPRVAGAPFTLLAVPRLARAGRAGAVGAAFGAALAVLTLASASWLVLEKVIESADWKAVVIGVVGAYMVGNVGELVATRKAE